MSDNPLKMAVNNVDHHTDSHVREDIPSMTKQEVEQSYQRRLQKVAGMDTNPRKKSCFAITRVIQKTGANEHNHEDQDSVDDLDETNTEDISSEILDASKQTDIDPDPSSEDTVQSIATEDLSKDTSAVPTSNHIDVLPNISNLQQNAANQKSDSSLDQSAPLEKIDTNQSLSRFKVVKIESSQPFRRGRWLCQDYLNPPEGHTQPEKLPEIKPDKPFDDHGSGNSSAASSVHYVPGVDDPGKNPLTEGFQNASESQQHGRSMQSPASAQTTTTPGYGDQTPHMSAVVASGVALSDVASATSSGYQSAGSTMMTNSTNGQPPTQQAQGSVPPTSFSQPLATVSQTQIPSNNVTSGTPGLQEYTDYIPNTDYIPSQPQNSTSNQAASSTASGQQTPAQTVPVLGQQEFQPAQTPAATSNASTTSVVAEQAKDSNSTVDFQTQKSIASASQASVQSGGGDVPAETASASGGSGGIDGAEKGATGQDQQPEGQRSPSIAAKGASSQSSLAPPLILQTLKAMDPQGANNDER